MVHIGGIDLNRPPFAMYEEDLWGAFLGQKAEPPTESTGPEEEEEGGEEEPPVS